jgi:hypothetical protein
MNEVVYPKPTAEKPRRKRGLFLWIMISTASKQKIIVYEKDDYCTGRRYYKYGCYVAKNRQASAACPAGTTRNEGCTTCTTAAACCYEYAGTSAAPTSTSTSTAKAAKKTYYCSPK